ncbi:hypothetical protein [Stieleria varia]|uniref:Uncharacterized protein n=1 Tax=Stieleria varia TaxID=2528005 RepID=A0A5C6B1L9_9BACT|nr:hypothetical protein [Stieleria varia]TWU05788.1 hypothetical protein Pla52n_15030 [Stieleria varia]
MADFETVHTMTDYYDGPRGGVADFRGTPHVYESEFSDTLGNYTDSFRLSPITDDLFQLALEDWAVWLRWNAAYKRGDTPHETHPALPDDRARHEELQRLLNGKLVIDPDNFVVATGEFRFTESLDQVRWSVAPPVA